MIKKSIRKHTRFLTCLVALAVVCATFLAGTFTTQAGVDVFGDIELKVGDTLGFVYYTSQPYTETTTMRFTVNGRTSESKAYSNDGKCVFIFNDIYPHELAKDVTATILVDGQEIVSSTGVSIKSFLLQMLMDPQSSEQERQFASDALQYGEQTRLYRNANIDVADRDDISITDDINTSIYKNYKPHDIDSDSDFIGSAEGLGVSASNIRLTSIGIAYHNTNSYVVTLQVPANSNVDLTKITVKIGDTEYTSTSFKAKGNGQYEVQSMPINAYDIMEGTQPHTTQFSLYVNGKVVQQASYNVLDYIYQLQDTTQSGSLALKYARALYRYGQSAENAYKGKRIISIALKENPAEIIPSSTGRQTPEEGKITAYYSDGTQQEIGSGIAWSNTDIYGNEIKIEDDTHLKQFTVRGAYRDDVSGKTFTVTGQVRLHNDITKVHRYTDPEIYRPAEFESTYTPTGTQLSCIWANGYRAVRSATHDAIDMTGYQFVEYGFIPTIASYTDPKSGITLSTETFLLYENPITSITINNTTASMLNGSNTTTPEHVKYIVTYHNNAQKERDTRHSSWFNVITSGTTTAKQVYSFQWSPVVYDGTEIQTTLDATGALSCPQYGAWERMLNGQTQSYNVMARNVSGQCDVVITNPEVGITIAAPPDVNGGTVLQTTPLTGHPDSTINGDLTGGSVYMLYSNGAQEPLLGNAVTYSCDSIDNTDYEKEVTVTATYIGKDGKEYRNTNRINIYNRIEEVVQERTPTVPSSSSINTLFELKNTAGTLKAVYTNGTSETVGDGTTKTTNIYLNGSNRNNQCYVQSIDTAVVTNAVRMNAGTSENDTTRDEIVVSYSDYRPTNPYDGSIKKIPSYNVKVVNTYRSIKPGQYTNNVTMTSATEVPTPTGALTVILSNGKEYTNVTPTDYTTPTAVTSAKEMEVQIVTAQCTASDGTVITGDVNCRVINRAVSATVKVDATPYTVQNSSQVPGTSITGGILTVTFLNGKSADMQNLTYTTTADAKITDNTLIKKRKITATWTGSYTSASVSDMYVILKNTPKTATLNLTSATQSNPILLTSNGAQPAGTISVTYDNGFVVTGQSCSVPAIGVGGAVNNTTATSKAFGSCPISASITIAASNYVTRKGSDSVRVEQESLNATTTAYWNNPLKKIVVKSSPTCPAKTHGTPEFNPDSTLTGQFTITMNNNKTVDIDATDSRISWSGRIKNIQDTAASETTSLKATCEINNIKQNVTVTITVQNPAISLSVEPPSGSFSNSTTVKIPYSATATLQNGRTLTNIAVTLNHDSKKHTYTGPSDATHKRVDKAIQVSYAPSTIGGEYTRWTRGYKASATINGATVEDTSVTLTVTNPPTSFSVYKSATSSDDSNKTNTATGGTSGTYGVVWFNKGSTTDSSDYDHLSGRITFANGRSYWLEGPDYLSAPVSHTKCGIYKNGDTFSAYTGRNGSLTKSTMQYTIPAARNGGEDSYLCTSNEFYLYTAASKYKTYRKALQLRFIDYNSVSEINPDDWKCNHEKRSFYKNRTTTTPSNFLDSTRTGGISATTTGLTSSTPYKCGFVAKKTATTLEHTVISSSCSFYYNKSTGGKLSLSLIGDEYAQTGWYSKNYYIAAQITATIDNTEYLPGNAWSYATNKDKM